MIDREPTFKYQGKEYHCKSEDGGKNEVVSDVIFQCSSYDLIKPPQVMSGDKSFATITVNDSRLVGMKNAYSLKIEDIASDNGLVYRIVVLATFAFEYAQREKKNSNLRFGTNLMLIGSALTLFAAVGTFV